MAETEMEVELLLFFFWKFLVIIYRIPFVMIEYLVYNQSIVYEVLNVVCKSCPVYVCNIALVERIS